MNEMTREIRLVTPIPGPKSQEWMARRDSAVPRGVSTILPVFVRKAEGAIVEDLDGNRFLDFAGGIGCQNVGHRSPAVVTAVQEQAGDFLHTCFMVTPYHGYVELAEKLNSCAPGNFPKKTILVNSGAEAVENAVKIARAYTRRPAIVSFEDAFHGRTLLTLGLTSKIHPYKTDFGPFPPEICRLPYAYCYRCSYRLTFPDCLVECARRLEDLFIRHVQSESVAAVLFEPVLGEGGFVVPPVEWFAEITKICRKHGVLIIADEVQTGFARTGPVFACERFGLEPDLLVTAKSLSAGMPLGGVTGRAEIMDAAGAGGLGSTFGGNPLSCAAALAAWRTLEELNLCERAEQLGQIFERVTDAWKERFPLIGDIRGVGAMRAIELVRDCTTREPAKQETQKVLSNCHRRGLIILPAGTYGNVIRILVPLVATDPMMEEGLSVLETALAVVHQKEGLP
jgi:4-aminobutyrate aminotransferase / (S)-3-amino-2-methylpropionate transaminase / 5-aminovalerate transaminase